MIEALLVNFSHCSDKISKLKKGNFYLAHRFVEVSVYSWIIHAQSYMAEGQWLMTMEDSENNKERAKRQVSVFLIFCRLPALWWM